MVVAGGGKQDCFHARAIGLGSAREKYMTDGFCARRTAGLAGEQHIVAGAAQPVGKPADLGRFARPFSALECHEQSRMIGHSASRIHLICGL